MLQIKELFQLNDLKTLTFYAGQRGAERTITSVTVMDIPELADWLSGGELVLAGVLFQQCFSKKLIDSFVSKNIAGIVTKEKFLTQIPKELIEYCNEIGFPILLAPVDYNWAQVMNPIISHIIRKPYLVLEENQRFHYSLTKSMIKGASLTEICNTLYHSNQLTLAIADTDLHLIGFSNHFDWKYYTRKLNSNSIQYSGFYMDNLDNEKITVYTYTTTLLISEGIRLFLFPIFLDDTLYGYIILALNAEIQEIDESIIMKIQQLSLLVALQFSKQNDINTATRHFNSMLFDELLQKESLSHDDAVQLLAPLQKKIHRKYYVLYFKSDSSTTVNSYLIQANRVGRFHSLIRNYFTNSDHILSFEKEGSQIILLPYPYDFFETDLLKLRELYIKTLKPEHLYIGVSLPLELSSFAEAYQQAKLTASFSASANKKLPYVEYKNLASIRYFINHSGELDYKFLNEILQRYITPLVEYDKRHNTELFRTLELYLANNCSKTQTEHQLFIHKNTLRARITTINKLLNCNIDSLEDLFEIQLAFRLRQLFGNNIPT